MRIGVFSDVHGNLEALNACLERFKKEGVEKYIYCGDIIGYGPDPEKCVKKILSLPLLACVLGNHDAVFKHPEIEAFFNYDAKVALDESKALMSEKSIRALASLPYMVHGDDFTVVHGTPSDPIKEYFSSCSQFHAYYEFWTGHLCFIGHTHLPFYMKGTSRSCSIYLNKKEDGTIRLTERARYVINPGSVGKPRDNNPAASFGIWDTEENTFRFLREKYDYSITQKKMEERKFPSFLIGSLTLGL